MPLFVRQQSTDNCLQSAVCSLLSIVYLQTTVDSRLQTVDC
ncbi:hypothetical protein SDC9_153843 [bioreactor metagenome]|uniref:Uncharacterized protein n=1 Tax=bioreactor metagenome TaxID=1076179 RepID=A0A645EXF2_9ZZZZ